MILGRIGAESDEDSVAVIVEVARDSQAVAAVVAAAAEDEDILIGRAAEHLQSHIGCAASGVFHQHDAGDVIFFDGQAIDPANLFSR